MIINFTISLHLIGILLTRSIQSIGKIEYLLIYIWLAGMRKRVRWAASQGGERNDKAERNNAY
jgi:hypothetical protein